ncbi:Uncharacterized protein HZ326_27016 [Fusarium oxysporum f. sp. albedinis]|nr:Uncharacterized protein HZ326_27016 [Fusarium oxysporum f. sp. albedinis]
MSNSNQETEFLPAFYAAFQATMTENNIKEAFKGAIPVTFNPKSVVSKLDVQVRIPTPVEEEARHPSPWISKTPKTVLEAESQSEYLERRVRRHQRSSPESILDALKSLSKGTKAVMHEMALMRSEIQDLRRANETLSRRRRAKRTRLQKGGTMTLEEGREAVGQKEVNAQAVAELSRSGGQRGSAQIKERHCGTCGKTGYDTRTFQIVAVISGEEYSG